MLIPKTFAIVFYFLIVIHFVCSSSWRVGMCTYRRALKDGAKVQGWEKTNSGIVGLWGDKRGYGRIKGDMGRELRFGEMAKTGERRRKPQFR